MTQAEIDEALARSDEINELQDTRVLAAAYRAEKARAERAEQVLATEHDLWVQAEAERDAADCGYLRDAIVNGDHSGILAHEALKEIEYRWSFDRYRPTVGKMAEGARCYAPTEEAARAKVASWYTDPEDEGTTFVLVDKGDPCDWMPDESGKIKCLKCGEMVYTRISGVCLDCHRLKSAKTVPMEDALAKLVMDLREMHGMTVCGEAWQELELDSEQMAAEIERYVESQLAAERDAAAESCRLMADRVARLVEANLGLREAALAYADLATCYRLGKAPSEGLFHRLDIARDALDKSKGGES